MSIWRSDRPTTVSQESNKVFVSSTRGIADQDIATGQDPLTRELQIRVTPRARSTTVKRAALWCFREMATLRRTLIQRAGRIIRPAGKPRLSMNSNQKLENELMSSLEALNALGA